MKVEASKDGSQRLMMHEYAELSRKLIKKESASPPVDGSPMFGGHHLLSSRGEQNLGH